MFVKRVCFLGIIADGIPRSHPQVFLRFVKRSGFFTETVEMIRFFYSDGVDTPAVAVFAEGKLRNVFMDQYSVLIVNGQEERILVDDDTKMIPLNHGFRITVVQLSWRCFHMPAFLSEKGIRTGVPRRHYKAVGAFIPISVKTGAYTENIIRQKPDPYFGSVRQNGITVFLPGNLFDCIADFHISSMPSWQHPATVFCR